MVALRDMQLYRESIHTRAAAEAALMAFVTTQEDQDAPTMTASGKTTDAGHPVEELTPGTVGYLSPGQDVKFNEPTASNGFGEVTKIAKQEILTAAGLTYEAAGDLSNVTWTSFRAGQLDHRRMVRHAQRELIVPLMMRRVYVQFVDAAIAAGLLPEAARAKQRKLVSGGVLVQGYPVRWQYPPFLEVDGAKQAQSTQALLRAGLATHEAEIEAATGMSMTEYLDAEARYRAEVVKRGLRFDSDPTATTQSGQAQSMPSDPEPVAAKPASSDAVMRALTPQAQAPTRLQASTRATCSGQFSAATSTRSPKWIPASRSSASSALTCSANWPSVLDKAATRAVPGRVAQLVRAQP